MTGATFHKTSLSLLFFIAGCVYLCFTWHGPLKDFGNYYYGSRLLLDGRFTRQMYTDLHYFNAQIASYGETDFFENYIPVPPLSALVYLPFCFFKSLGAKFIFNLLSLLLFCNSIYRLQAFLGSYSKLNYLLPLVFIFPLYSNIAQGQAYVLICALLLEAFMACEKKQIYFSALLLALVISLKIFPVVILVYFLVKRDFKFAGLAAAFVILFQLLSFVLLPAGTTTFYFSDVLPRLLNNDIVGAYHHGNQSVYTALLQLFSFDALSNPDPVFHSPFLIILFESLFVTLVLALLFSWRDRKNDFLFYAFTVFGSLLLSRYTTSYGLFLILPLCLSFAAAGIKPAALILFLACAAFTVSIPVNSLAAFPFILKFARLWGLLVLLLIMLLSLNLKTDYKVYLLLFIPVACFKYFSFAAKPADYFTLQNTQGILYDIAINKDSITFKSTLGAHDVSETVKLPGKSGLAADLVIRGDRIYYKNKLICATKDHKLKPFIYNDSLVVFMSDLNQGIRFYKLRTLPLAK